MKCKSISGLEQVKVGHHYPGQCSSPLPKKTSLDELGAPLGIREVAQLIGCSVWSVRQRQIPAGLPHFRTGPSGRLIFYQDQVVRWILKKQKGDTGS
jgi:hypothetical protein